MIARVLDSINLISRVQYANINKERKLGNQQNLYMHGIFFNMQSYYVLFVSLDYIKHNHLL